MDDLYQLSGNKRTRNGTSLWKSGLTDGGGRMRLIDADTLMKAMYHRAFETDGATMWQRGCWVRYRAIEQTVKEQPTVNQWIPCSERLPEIEDHHVSKPCLVYCKTEVEEGYVYCFAELEENIFGQVGWNCERDDEYHEPIGEVIAWMPLPEPYKGEADG